MVAHKLKTNMKVWLIRERNSQNSVIIVCEKMKTSPIMRYIEDAFVGL
jgi:hypothetical protein